MEEIFSIVDNWIMWVFAFALTGFVLFVSLRFAKLARAFASENDLLTKEEMKIAFKTGLIGTIGPAIAVILVAIGLVSQLGGAVTFMRVGVIGSAPLELLLAGIGADAYGAPIGSEAFDIYAYATSLWTMVLVVGGWLVSIFFITKRLSNMKLKSEKKDPRLMMLIGTVTPVMIFLVMTGDKVVESKGSAVAVITSLVVMFGIQKAIANNKLLWMREWAVGITMILAMAAATIIGG